MYSLFETNFMSTLRKVFISGMVYDYPNSDKGRAIRSVGEIYKIPKNAVPLLQTSKIDDDMINDIRNSAKNVTANISCDVLTDVSGVCEHANALFKFFQTENVLHMLVMISHYDMINDHVKPMLECFFILNDIASLNGLESGDIYIMCGESIIREDDESIAYDLIHRLSYIVDDTIEKLYLCPEHEVNRQKIFQHMTTVSNKLDTIERINASDDRNFDDSSIPADSIKVLKSMSKEEVCHFINDGRKSIENEKRNIEEMDDFMKSNKSCIEDIIKHHDSIPVISSNGNDAYVYTENYYALPSLLK